MSITKNIQIIDGAINCTYDIYSISDADFQLLFPADGQDIEFAEDLDSRLSEGTWKELSERLWLNRLDKKNVHGIHGTIFYGMEFKREFYPNKKESDLG